MWPEVEQTPGSLRHLSNTTTFQRGKSHTAESEGGKDHEPRGLFRCLNKMSFQVHGQNKDHLTFAGHRAATSLDSLVSPLLSGPMELLPVPPMSQSFNLCHESELMASCIWNTLLSSAALTGSALLFFRSHLNKSTEKPALIPPNRISYFVSRLLCTLTPFHLFIYQDFHFVYILMSFEKSVYSSS